MFLRELFEAKARRIVAVMPGGFHPFHPGHKSLYDWAVKTFGEKNVYVAATNDTAARPFPFEVKKKLAAMAGVPESNFIQVKSPFNAMSYKNIIDTDTALVFVRSQKDKAEQPLPDQTKKNGEPGYLRTYTGKDLNTADEMGYMAYGPTINFDFSGMQIKSASELRATWPEMSDEDKLKAAKLMYGNGAEAAVQLLNQALAPVGESFWDEMTPGQKDMLQKQMSYTEKMWNKDTLEKYGKTLDQFDKIRKKLDGKVVKINGEEAELEFEMDAAGFIGVFDNNSGEEVNPFTLKFMKTNEIMSFGIKRSPKRATIKKKPEKFEPSLRDKIAARRKAAAQGDKDAWASGKELPKNEAQLDEIAPAVGIAAKWIIKWAIQKGAWSVLKWILKKYWKKIAVGTIAYKAIDEGWDWVKGQIGEEMAQMLIDNGFEIGMAVALIVGAVMLKRWVEKHGEKFATRYAEGDTAWMN
jgi:hypothetical protein